MYTLSSHSPGISEPDQSHMDLPSALSLSVQKVSQKYILLLSWLTVSQALPAIFRGIGVYVFDSPPPLMLPLGALLLLTVVIAGLARSSLSMSIQERRVLARHSNALKTLAVASEVCAVFGCLSRFQSALDLIEDLLRSQLCTSHGEAPLSAEDYHAVHISALGGASSHAVPHRHLRYASCAGQASVEIWRTLAHCSSPCSALAGGLASGACLGA